MCPACVLLGACGEVDPPGVPLLDEIQAAFPQFEILECIGRGGMGVVYKVRQPQLDRLLALKILLPGLEHDPGFAERFSREARALAKLGHPNIVAVHDFGETGGFFWLTMEYVDGVNLRQAMQAARFTPAQALALIPDLCAALQYAHDHGILHRDIKPENILLDTRGRVKIADFGIARIAGDERGEFTLTRTGSVLGSAAYIAPEQIERPHDVDHRADLYSLGVVFYEMLTGELPLGRFPAPSEKSASDPRLDEVVFRTLEKEREKRYQSADELRAGVEKSESAPMAKSEISSAAPTGLPWCVKLPVLLVLGGLLGITLLIMSLPEGMGDYFWRLLTFRAGYRALNVSTGLRIFLNLWFGLGLATLASGLGLGLRTLYHMKSARQPATGRNLLCGYILWPLILLVTGYFINWIAGGSYPIVLGEGVMPFVQAIIFGGVFILCGTLFYLTSPPESRNLPSREVRKISAAVSILLLFSAAFVTKRLYNHWSEHYSSFEFGWDISSLPEAKRTELTKVAASAAGRFKGKLMLSRDTEKLTVRFLVPQGGIYVMVYKNSFLQRFRALAPDDLRPLIKEPGYDTNLWFDAKKELHWPTIFVVIATAISALLAAWCGLPLGLLPAMSGLVIAGILAVLPAWPIPEHLANRVISGNPLDPLQPLFPDFSEPTIAVQSVLDAAFLGEERLVAQGLSKRFLAELENSGTLAEATRFLGKGMWATHNYGNAPDRVHIEMADGSKALEVQLVREDRKWKLDELPKPPK